MESRLAAFAIASRVDRRGMRKASALPGGQADARIPPVGVLDRLDRRRDDAAF